MTTNKIPGSDLTFFEGTEGVKPFVVCKTHSRTLDEGDLIHVHLDGESIPVCVDCFLKGVSEMQSDFGVAEESKEQIYGDS